MKNKSKLIILQVFIAIILVCTSVYAAIETGIGVKVSKSTLNRGDTLDVTLSIEGVKADQKIKNVEGYINYDKNILEKITFDSIVKDNNKQVKIGDEKLTVEDITNAENINSSSAYVAFNGSPETDNDVKIIIDLNTGITKDTELLTIKFKVKEDADLKEVKDAIKYAFTASDGTEKSEEMTKNINLTIEKKAEPPQEDKKEENKADENAVGKVNNTNTNTNNTNKNTNKNTSTNKVNNTNTDNTLAKNNLPATGAKVFVIPAIVLIALAYISYNKYIRMKGI